MKRFGRALDGHDRRSVLEFEVGDYFDDPQDQMAVLVALIPCEDPHDNEAYAVIDNPLGTGEPFPGHDTLAAFAREVCTDAFLDFVGVSVFSSDLDAYWRWPAISEWIAEVQATVRMPHDAELAKARRFDARH